MGIQEFPKCCKCGKPFIGKNVKLTVGYPKFCSMKCMSNDNGVLLKRQQSCEAKYGIGITNPSQAECIKRQKAETSFKHYGVSNPNHAKVVRQKIEQTNLRVRGAKCPFTAEAVKAKIAATNIKRIGVANPFELPNAAYKSLQARLEKYGNARGKMRIYDFNGIIFDSSWELAVWIYHVDHAIPIERLPVQLQYERDNSTHIYLPDFRIAGKLVEVKGDHMFDKQGNPVFDGKHPWTEKYQCMLENNVEIWRSKDVKPFIAYVRQKYGAGYLKSFRIEKPVDKAQ